MKQSSKNQREELTSVLTECDRIVKTGMDERLAGIGDNLCEEITTIGDIIGRLLACDIMEGVEEVS